MLPEVAARVRVIEPFMVMEILETARQMENRGTPVIHLEIGEPDFETPEIIRREACDAITSGFTHYTASKGWSPLREKIADLAGASRGVHYDPDSEVLVTAGSSPAFLLAFSTLLDPGDGVVLTNPCYACYPNFVRFFGGQVQSVPVHEDNGFALDPADLLEHVTPETKAILLNSPANPTGGVIPQENLRALAEIAVDHDLWVISDEIYSEIVYEGDSAPSILEFPGMKERTVLLDGFSKFYAMTGWRLGYACAPAALTRVMDTVQQNFVICAPSVSQVAALAALGPDLATPTSEMLTTYRARRDAIVAGLNAIDGIHCRLPEGAFYAFANVSALDSNSVRFARGLLEEAHVAATPGVAFGSHGEGFVRFSYANSLANIQQALPKIAEFASRLG